MTRDGRYLLFNTSNDPSVDTNLQFAERVDDLTFQYRGEIKGANSSALDGVPTMDRHNTFYFVSTRSYDVTSSTVYRGTFADGTVSGVELVPGISRQEPGIVNFDIEVNPDGDTLYFVDARFGKNGPETADIVIAERRGTGFQRSPDSARLMQRVNTADLEYAPCISKDGLMLLFTRLHGGGTIILVSRRGRVTEPFEQPMQLVALEGMVEAPTLSPNEKSVYYHRRGGDTFVIYRASR